MKRKSNFFRHLHPPLIRRRTINPSTTLGLGVVCLTCVLILGITGATMFFYYIPEEGTAYDRILHITTALRFGRLLRNLHYHAANVLMIVGWLHLARVYFTGSYEKRIWNWLYGLLLLILILLSNYTGYLLPWDQTAYWAIKVGSNLAGYFPVLGPSLKNFLLGGEDVSQETLIRSFAIHVAILPLLWIIFISLHLWRIRQDGGLAAPADDNSIRIPAFPWLFRAEIAIGLLTISLLLILSLFIEAPLSSRADPFHSPNPAKAPWYFVGIQEMVSYSATWGGVVVPSLIALFLFLTPFIDRTKGKGGIWWARERWLFNFIFILIMLSQIAMIVIGQWLRTKNWMLIIPW